MADRIEGKTAREKSMSPDSSELLEKTLQACSTEDLKRFPAARIQSFVVLLRRIDTLTASLAEDIATV
jgi:hypothetical protein